MLLITNTKPHFWMGKRPHDLSVDLVIGHNFNRQINFTYWSLEKIKKTQFFPPHLYNLHSPSSACLHLNTTPSLGPKGAEGVNSVRDHTVAFYPDSPPGLFQEKSRCMPKGCFAKQSVSLYKRCNTCKVPLCALITVLSLFVFFFCLVSNYRG